MALVLPCPSVPSAPVLHGYLLRKTLSEKWVRYWCVIQGGCLYCYLTPDDHVSVDVTDLHGYSVTSHEDTFQDQRYVLHLEHKDYIPVYLSATCKKEMEEWKASLTSVLKNTQPTDRPVDQNQTDEGSSSGGSEDRALVIKQKLLAEVLRQTQELERKQSSRMATTNRQSPLTLREADGNPSTSSTTTAGRSLTSSATPTSTPSPNYNGQSAGEQICTRTRLQQRRMSAQIKLETLQRQIETNNNANSKKSIFSFGKKKNNNSNSNNNDDNSTAHSSDIVQQLKALSEHLSAIDRDLVLNNGALNVDPKMTSVSSEASLLSASTEQLRRPPVTERLLLNRSNSSRSRRSSNGNGDSRLPFTGGGMGGSGGVVRSNSLKSSMQKLAHKTFAKAGWYRNKKSSQSDVSGDRVTSPGSDVPTTRVGPDVIDLSHCLRRSCSARDVIMDCGEEGEGGDECDGFLPPPSPFKTTPSPSSTPRCLSSVSPAGGGGRRHSSSGSLQCFHDDPKSPRQRMDPNAIAHIEAFEEMSRQILGEGAA